MSQHDTRALTLRLEPGLYEAARRLAQKKDVSLNALFKTSLQSAIEQEEEKARYDMYTELGSDPECDVEFAIHAQAEVVLSEEA